MFKELMIMETTEFSTTHLATLRELRAQEKAIKAQLEIVLPLAKEEAILITANQGGKFAVEGVGEFVLDVNPILEKDPENENDTAPDIHTSRDENAVSYRKLLKVQNGYKAQAGALTKTIKGFYDAFRTKFGHRATRHTYTLKCLGLD
jgi:hypothetical protein